MKKRIIKITILIVILAAIAIPIVVSIVHRQNEYNKRMESYKEKYLYNGSGSVSLDDLEKSFEEHVDSIVGNE